MAIGRRLAIKLLNATKFKAIGRETEPSCRLPAVAHWDPATRLSRWIARSWPRWRL